MNQIQTLEEWDVEPNILVGDSHGYIMVIQRSPQFKHLCGYVGVPIGHPANQGEDNYPDYNVHGGITWASEENPVQCLYLGGDEGESDVDKVAAIAEGVFWLGFDCCHGCDFVPGHLDFMPVRLMIGADKYRNLAYVQAECESLAKQLFESALPQLENNNGAN